MSLLSISSRLYDVQVSTAKRLYTEGYISRTDANLGAIFGLGFCPWSGGPV